MTPIGIPVSEQSEEDGSNYLEFRRKMKYLEVLSASMEQLLRSMRFTGKVNVQIENGRVLKSQYEEGYFRRQPPI
jgi:hypothetical protein